MEIKDIFEKYKTIAVYGMSASPYKAAHNVPAFFHNMGYRIIPINPHADEILGLKVYRNLIDIPEKIDIVNVFRPSEDAELVINEAIERFKKEGDIKVIWLQEGIFSIHGKEAALNNGIDFVEDRCMYKDYLNL